VKARIQRPDGAYVRVERGPDEPPLRSQVALQGQARDSAREGDAKHRLFVPIVRLAGRNGGNGAKTEERRGARARVKRQSARKKIVPK
jgi:hypothetical protein